MMVNKQGDLVTISLSRIDIGQLIDGLSVRRDAWRYTQRYLEEGYMEPERLIEECSDIEEAKSIADHYNDIIENIEKQLNKFRQKA
ncbi:MAG: hypothetical protein JEZ07_01390 [Phycisphaerae bacterium]|nr:hypothetical protein [Phycisphaerae bacterium]